MSNLNRNLLIFAIFLGLLIVVALVTGDDSVERIKLVEADSVDVAGIRITTAEDTVDLHLDDGRWMIREPIQFPASARQVETLIGKLISTDMSGVALTEDPEHWEDYDITDSLATEVIVTTKDGDEGTFYVASGSLRGMTNIRFRDDDAVYQSTENLIPHIPSDLQRWRERKLILLEENEVAAVSLNSPVNSFSLTFANSQWKLHKDGIERTIHVENEELSNLLSTITRISSSKFIDDRWDEFKDRFENIELEFEVESLSGKTTKLEFVPDENQYIVRKNGDTQFLYNVGKYYVDKLRDTFRDKNAVPVGENDIASVEVQYSQNTYTLTRDQSGQWKYTDREDSFDIPAGNSQLMEILKMLTDTDAKRFEDNQADKYSEAFEDSRLSVEVKAVDGAIFKLSLAEMPDRGNEFLLMTNGEINRLKVFGSDFMNAFTRSANHFKREPQKPEPVESAPSETIQLKTSQ